MKSISDIGFEANYRSFSEVELKKILDMVYNNFAERLNCEASFGINGCKEFLGSIILGVYDKSVYEYIVQGTDNVFNKKFGPLDFSDYMDKVVDKSIITMTAWNNFYNYIDQNHKWIEKHPCAVGKTKTSSFWGYEV